MKRVGPSHRPRASTTGMRRTCAVHRCGMRRAGPSAHDVRDAMQLPGSSMNVGFIGLGTMGSPMAENVLKGGHRIIVADVQAAPVDKLVSLGARKGTTPREVAAASEIVITMLPDAPDVERVAFGADGVIAGIRAGSIYVDMSTID